MATRINADGSTADVAPLDGRAFALDELQGIVAGYIEAIYLRDGRIMFCNEDGKRLGLAPNRAATTIARSHAAIVPGDTVVGDVIVGTRREFGE
jgi:hypothetical protein